MTHEILNFQSHDSLQGCCLLLRMRDVINMFYRTCVVTYHNKNLSCLVEVIDIFTIVIDHADNNQTKQNTTGKIVHTRFFVETLKRGKTTSNKESLSERDIQGRACYNTIYKVYQPHRAIGVCCPTAMAPLTHTLSIPLTVHTSYRGHNQLQLYNRKNDDSALIMFSLGAFILIHNIGLLQIQPLVGFGFDYLATNESNNQFGPCFDSSLSSHSRVIFLINSPFTPMGGVRQFCSLSTDSEFVHRQVLREHVRSIVVSMNLHEGKLSFFTRVNTPATSDTSSIYAWSGSGMQHSWLDV